MDDDYYEDLPVVRAAFDKLVARFPENLFKMYWVSEVGEFFVVVNDPELMHSAEYWQFIHKLEAELFNRTLCRVVFSCRSFDATEPKGSKYEINSYSEGAEAPIT